MYIVFTPKKQYTCTHLLAIYGDIFVDPIFLEETCHTHTKVDQHGCTHGGQEIVSFQIKVHKILFSS